MNEPLRTNWAGNITFGAPGFLRPATVPELQAVVARGRRIRVLATGHSFNDLADSRAPRSAWPACRRRSRSTRPPAWPGWPRA